MTYRYPTRMAAVLLSALALLSACGGGGGANPSPAAPPSISSLSPSAGPIAGGTSVTVLGTDFGSGARVAFGTTPARVLSVTAGSIVVALTPAHAVGAVDLVVTNPDGQSARVAGGFIFEEPPTLPPPSVLSVSPSSGLATGGTTVTIAGANFVAGAAVEFGTVAAAVNAVLPGAITAVTPAHAAGQVDVLVRNPDGRSASVANGFTFQDSAPPPPGPAPVLASVTPTAGTTLGGTDVTVSGTNFASGATVFIGGAVAAVTGAAAGSLTVATPPHAAGAADVTVVNPDGGTGTLPGAFTYQAPPPPAPTVSGVAPTTGPTAGGTTVTVTGTNFASGATVSFGGAAGTATVQSATSITVTTPARAAGAAGVTVRNPDGGSFTLANAFTFEAPTTGTPPTISSLSPDHGPSAGGTTCVVSGTGFVAGTAVVFGGTPATLTPGTVITATSMSVTVPAHAVGVVDVSVVNPGGLTTTRAGGYTFLGPPPVVLALNVRGGPTAGGTRVLAVGSGFVPGVSVAVGGEPATNISLLDAGSGRIAVSFFTPPRPEGRYDVVVTNPDRQVATVVNGFHYGPAPVITGLTCSGGCDTVRRDHLITLAGANFSTGPGEGFSVHFTSVDTGQAALAVVDTTTTPTSTEIVVVAPKLDGGIPVRLYYVAISNFDGQTGVAPSQVTYK